jgi:hypothetical protein
MPAVILYEHADFGGNHLVLTGDDASLVDDIMSTVLWWNTSWNDQVSSLRVIDGTVSLYEHIGFGGQKIDFGPGDYAYIGDLWNDNASSVDIW